MQGGPDSVNVDANVCVYMRRDEEQPNSSVEVRGDGRMELAMVKVANGETEAGSNPWRVSRMKAHSYSTDGFHAFFAADKKAIEAAPDVFSKVFRWFRVM